MIWWFGVVKQPIVVTKVSSWLAGWVRPKTCHRENLYSDVTRILEEVDGINKVDSTLFLICAVLLSEIPVLDQSV